MCLFLRFLSNALNSVRVTVGLLLLVLGRCNILALLVVDIAAEFETKITLGRGSRGGTIGSWERLARRNRRLWAGLERLQSPRCIGNDAEVAGEWRADVGGAGLRVDLGMSISVLGERKKIEYSPGS